MSHPRFLVDENVPLPLILALLRREPTMDLLRVGQPGAPPRRTPDPDLLLAAEAMGRILLSDDKRTMPRHIADHWAAGHHTCGALLMRQAFPLARFLQDILLIWHATTPDEWVDQLVYIPF